MAFEMHFGRPSGQGSGLESTRTANTETGTTQRTSSSLPFVFILKPNTNQPLQNKLAHSNMTWHQSNAFLGALRRSQMSSQHTVRT